MSKLDELEQIEEAADQTNSDGWQTTRDRARAKAMPALLECARLVEEMAIDGGDWIDSSQPEKIINGYLERARAAIEKLEGDQS